MPVLVCFGFLNQTDANSVCFGWVCSSCFDQMLSSFVFETTESGPEFAFNLQILRSEPGALSSPRTDASLSGCFWHGDRMLHSITKKQNSLMLLLRLKLVLPG